MIAIDSSSFIRYYDGIIDRTTALVDHALANQTVALPPVAVTELLSDHAASDEFRAGVVRIPLLLLLDGYWQRAGDLRADLMRVGRKAKLADCLIAQACIDNAAPLITYDRDFRHFEKAGLKLL